VGAGVVLLYRSAGLGPGVKLLALLTDGFGASGGIARYNCDLMTALSQSAAISQVVALPRFGDGSIAPPARIMQMKPEPPRVRWSAKAIDLVLRQRFDVILCGHLYAAPLAAALSAMTGARLWLQVHGVEAWTPLGSIVRHSVERASLITSVSRFTRRRLLGWCALAPERVRVLPNTVGHAFEPRQPRTDLIHRHGLAGKKVILTVSRLASGERYKGHDRIIHAMPTVLRTHPSAIYLIVGLGDDRPRLKALAREIGLADRVIFAGQVAGDELPDYFALADVYAMPSTGEGFGIVFLEAAACGLPVIGGNRDGSLDALADGTVGRAVDPEGSEALADALIGALGGRIVPDRAAVARFAFSNFSAHVDDLIRQLH
jgi:phosphatidyl-myo-inositol dimannoside synthase